METDVNDKSADTLIELWKKLVDLHIFHDDLKQQRLRTFLIVQAALLIGFGLTLSLTFDAKTTIAQTTFIVLAIGVIYFGHVLTGRTEQMDKRTADYVRTVKNQLRNIEFRLKAQVPQLKTLPYDGQFKVLNEHSLTLDASGHYTDLVTAANTQKNFTIIAEHPATYHERRLIRSIGLIWGLATLLIIGVALALTLPYVPLLGRFI